MVCYRSNPGAIPNKSYAHCYNPTLITESKTSYIRNICALFGGRPSTFRAFFGFCLSPHVPWGVKVPGFRSQNACALSAPTALGDTVVTLGQQPPCPAPRSQRSPCQPLAPVSLTKTDACLKDFGPRKANPEDMTPPADSS